MVVYYYLSTLIKLERESGQWVVQVPWRIIKGPDEFLGSRANQSWTTLHQKIRRNRSFKKADHLSRSGRSPGRIQIWSLVVDLGHMVESLFHQAKELGHYFLCTGDYNGFRVEDHIIWDDLSGTSALNWLKGEEVKRSCLKESSLCYGLCCILSPICIWSLCLQCFRMWPFLEIRSWKDD
jgi:hypothetical protein